MKYTERLAPETMRLPASSVAPITSAIPGRVAISAGLITRSRPSSATSATNQVASSVTTTADSVGRIGARLGNGRATWTIAPTTRPRNRCASRPFQVGSTTMPNPTVVSA